MFRQRISWFENAANALDRRYRVQIDEVMNQVDAEMSAKGKFESGAHIIQVEQALVHHFDKYADALIELLIKFDPSHSPVRPKNFDAAIGYASKFVGTCKKKYEARVEQSYSHYPQSRDLFPDAGLWTALSRATSEIEGRKAEFVSSTSFWKWALGDMRKRVWSAALFTAGILISKIYSWLFALFS